MNFSRLFYIYLSPSSRTTGLCICKKMKGTKQLQIQMANYICGACKCHCQKLFFGRNIIEGAGFLCTLQRHHGLLIVFIFLFLINHHTTLKKNITDRSTTLFFFFITRIFFLSIVLLKRNCSHLVKLH
jgi:hypothetical protein